MSDASFTEIWTEEEWQEWYRLTPQERWSESMKLWDLYLLLGGSLDPAPDPASPFDPDLAMDSETPANQPNIHFVRRQGHLFIYWDS